jgi:hypothetical protein
MVDGRRGYSYYRCRVRHSDGHCSAPAKISTRQVDPYIERLFLDHVPRLQASGFPVDDSSDALAALEGAESELAEYRDANLISVIGKESYLEGLAERTRRVEQSRAVYAEARRGMQGATVTADLHKGWSDFSDDEKAQLLRSVIEAIHVKRANRPGQGSRVEDRVRVVWR